MLANQAHNMDQLDPHPKSRGHLTQVYRAMVVGGGIPLNSDPPVWRISVLSTWLNLYGEEFWYVVNVRILMRMTYC